MTDLAMKTLDLARRFGSILAVDRLSLHVPRGCVYGFLGPNGAGKTTTIRMLLGLIRPDGGEIQLFGEPLTRTTRRGLLRRIGALVEAPSVYPHLTGAENLRVTQELAGMDRTRIAEVLRIVKLERDADRLVQGYSQGMRQRLGIALALLGRPSLLVLDEPTNGLDPAGIHEIRDLIRGFASDHGITVFLSSHLLAEVEQIATHVGILGQGRLLFEGTLEELQRRHADSIEIEVDRPEPAASILREGGLKVERTGGASLTVTVSGRAEVARAASLLVGGGISLYQIRTVRPTLEDLFLDLTREAGIGSAPAGRVSR
ncbi:MAG TPA: ATP-binding cassette domain-containing protein [Planctomycetota bacterium]|nr:ATP-binding cassette domain-containing protein [Planctomycetota bacterium]